MHVFNFFGSICDVRLRVASLAGVSMVRQTLTRYPPIMPHQHSPWRWPRTHLQKSMFCRSCRKSCPVSPPILVSVVLPRIRAHILRWSHEADRDVLWRREGVFGWLGGFAICAHAFHFMLAVLFQTLASRRLCASWCVCTRVKVARCASIMLRQVGFCGCVARYAAQ